MVIQVQEVRKKSCYSSAAHDGITEDDSQVSTTSDVKLIGKTLDRRLIEETAIRT